jgi:hypothetical protein
MKAISMAINTGNYSIRNQYFKIYTTEMIKSEDNLGDDNSYS